MIKKSLHVSIMIMSVLSLCLVGCGAEVATETGLDVESAVATAVAEVAPETDVDMDSVVATAVAEAVAEAQKAPETEEGDSAPGVVWVEFFIPWGGSFGEFINELVEDFNTNQSDVKVMVIQVGSTYEEILAKVQARIAAGDPPDVSIQGFLYTDYIAQNLPYHSLDDVVNDPEFDVADVNPGFLGLGQYDGEQVALPFSVSAPVLFYNAELFRDAGLDPDDPPLTYNEVQAAAEALTKDTDGDGEVDQWGVFFKQHSWYFQNVCQSFGGVLMTTDGQIAFNEAPCVEALEYMVDLQEAGYMPALTNTQAQASFTSGTIGMYINTSSFEKSISQAAEFDVRTAPHPYKDNPSVAAGGANVFIFSEDPVKFEATWRFVKWLTSKEGTTIISTNTGYMPIRDSVLTDPDYMAGFMEENPNYWSAINQVDFMTPWQNFPGGPQIVGIIGTALQSALAGTPAQEALDSAAAEAELVIEQEQ